MILFTLAVEDEEFRRDTGNGEVTEGSMTEGPKVKQGYLKRDQRYVNKAKRILRSRDGG